MSLTKVQVSRLNQLISDLRSGKYKQGQSFLAQTQNKEIRYCCLGVACERYRKNTKLKINNFWKLALPSSFFVLKEFNEQNGELPDEIAKYYGFPRHSGFIVIIRIQSLGIRKASLIELNDSEDKDFNFIANCIEGFIANGGKEGFVVSMETGVFISQ